MDQGPGRGEVWRPFDSHRQALMRSHERLRETQFFANTTSEDALAALAEWIHWVISLDDQYLQLVGRGDYEESRRDSPISHSILGVRYAWALTRRQSHVLKSMVTRTGGSVSPTEKAPTFREITWVAFELVPPPDDEYRRQLGFPAEQDAYRRFLAGRPVRLLAADITKHLYEFSAGDVRWPPP